ncbi:MAG TPA: hypothetical protein PKC39_11820 [Ferruginibacter sp.]|nr:hypothetical protein [Ferruginibacter sp.]HMP21638.1 hypothetical protein [Ferruginibacter sp.]
MKDSNTHSCSSNNKYINRLGYILFVALALYFFGPGKNFTQGISNLGIAMIFDPFNPKQSWQCRPWFQRAWLLLHVSIIIGGFIYLLSTK